MLTYHSEKWLIPEPLTTGIFSYITLPLTRGRSPKPSPWGQNQFGVGDGVEEAPTGLFRATIYLLHFLAFHGGADVNHKNYILVQFS